jgi:hypothetical protein
MVVNKGDSLRLALLRAVQLVSAIESVSSLQ